MRLYVVLLVCALIAGCGDEQAAIGSMEGGRSPEWTVKKYQQFVDQNQFEEAKEISTPAEQARLDQLAAVMVRESLAETVLSTRFLQINCDAEGAVSYCQCLVEDEYERYELVYKLTWRQGQWLVDAPDNKGVGEEEVIDGVLNGMKEIMQ
jgi:hypothetical protein